MHPRKFLAAALIGLLATSAPAAIQVQYINRGTPASATHTATGYTGYTIRLVETTGAKITAIDLESGNNGLFGRFVQRWISLEEDGTYTWDTLFNTGANAENLTPSLANFDSHLLEPGSPKSFANIVGLINPREDLGGATFGPIGPNPPFPNNTNLVGITISGANGSLQAAFGINASAQSSTLDLAYIVLPNEPSARVGGTALVAVGGGAPQLVILSPLPPPPQPAEPSTVLPLAYCAALLLRRRARGDTKVDFAVQRPRVNKKTRRLFNTTRVHSSP
jgi:hypothetical protein